MRKKPWTNTIHMLAFLIYPRPTSNDDVDDDDDSQGQVLFFAGNTFNLNHFFFGSSSSLILKSVFLPFFPLSSSLPTIFPPGEYSQTTYHPSALSGRPPSSFSSVYPQSTAAHPTSVVSLQTSCVKCPVASVYPVGSRKSYMSRSSPQARIDAVALEYPKARFSP